MYTRMLLALALLLPACGGRVREGGALFEGPPSLPEAFCQARELCPQPTGDTITSWPVAAGLEIGIARDASYETCIERGQILDDYMPASAIPGAITDLQANPCHPSFTNYGPNTVEP